MDTTGNAVMIYALYVAVAVSLTMWLAHTLFRSGTAFLHDVFEDKPGLADSVNRLLVVGFYMLNLGYALFVLVGASRLGQDSARSAAIRGLDLFGAVEYLVNRLAVLLVSLALIHFLNVFVFWRIRIRREQRDLPMPTVARSFVPEPPVATEE